MELTVTVEAAPTHCEDADGEVNTLIFGTGLTVNSVVVVQPPPSVYVTVALPPATPVITPVVLPAVAIAVLLLLQVPPTVASVKVVVEPAHTTGVPAIAEGAVLTDTTWLTLQPAGNTYEITGVPAEIPLTTPLDDPAVAIAGSLLLQVPPDGVLPNVVVKPIHTLPAPVMVAGEGFTVIGWAAVQPAPNE